MPRHSQSRRAPHWLLSAILAFGFIVGSVLAWGVAMMTGIAAVQGTYATNEQIMQPSELLLETVSQLAQDDRTPTDPHELHPWAKHSFVPAIMYHDVVAGEKDVWFDHSVEEFKADLEAIRTSGATPITIDQLYDHLHFGAELPEKPVLLTFDDAYLGQYENAYPLLKEYNYPAVFYVHTGFVGSLAGKPKFSWDDVRLMHSEGLITFASHTVNHPNDLSLLDDAQLRRELFDSKARIEQELADFDFEVKYFSYPVGNRDDRVLEMTKAAGYAMAVTMDSGYTNQSPNLLEVRRFNHLRVAEALLGSAYVPPGQLQAHNLNVTNPLQVRTDTVGRVRISTIRGGRIATVHADRRYEVGTLMQRYQATAGVNGGFFAVPWIYSDDNVMIGPVMSANKGEFMPGRPEDIGALRGRPLVLLGDDRVSFLPFQPETMNDLDSIRQLMPEVKDVFVAGLWLVKDDRALTQQEIDSYGLTSAEELRPRAFLGVDQFGQAIVGVSNSYITSQALAESLPALGVKEAILLDSGFSSALQFGSDILASGHATAEMPSRPVPHAIMVYDLNTLQAANDPLESLLGQLEPRDRDQAIITLEAVLRGDITLQRGDRGPAVQAVQFALQALASASTRGTANEVPLASGADGVYGGEVSLAIMPYLSDRSPALASTSATGALDGSVITAETLRNLLRAYADLPSPILVDPTMPRRS